MAHFTCAAAYHHDIRLHVVTHLPSTHITTHAISFHTHDMHCSAQTCVCISRCHWTWHYMALAHSTKIYSNHSPNYGCTYGCGTSVRNSLGVAFTQSSTSYHQSKPSAPCIQRLPHSTNIRHTPWHLCWRHQHYASHGRQH